jgi:hypothetical protein
MRKTFIILMMITAIVSTPALAIDLHELNGSDLGLGTGARAISMGGAFTALADDASAIYWNPAGLTEVKTNEITMMAYPNPTRYSFKAIVYRPEKWERSKTKLTVAAAQINRLKFIGDGDWGVGNAGHLIDLSMIAVERNYVGGLNSRTTDHRISIAGRVPGNEKLSLGLNFIDFECVTTFYMTNSGRVCQIVAYKTIDFGGLYRLNDKHNFALTLRNPVEKSKPKYLTVGTAWLRPDYRVTLDIEYIFGEYSNEFRKCNFIMIRSGFEKDINQRLKARAGVVYPFRARTSTLGDIRAKIPSPKIDATIGAGYTFKHFTVDLALYGDPGKSYVLDELKLGSALSVTYDF